MPMMRCEQNVHMVRHHRPGEQIVSLSVEKFQGVANDFSEAWIGNRLRSGRSMQRGFDDRFRERLEFRLQRHQLWSGVAGAGGLQRHGDALC